jgi:hypothetical protein
MPLVGELANSGEASAFGPKGIFTHSVDINLPRSTVFVKTFQAGSHAWDLTRGRLQCGLLESETVNETLQLPGIVHHYFDPIWKNPRLHWASKDVIGVTVGFSAETFAPGGIRGWFVWTLGFWD